MKLTDTHTNVLTVLRRKKDPVTAADISAGLTPVPYATLLKVLRELTDVGYVSTSGKGYMRIWFYQITDAGR